MTDTCSAPCCTPRCPTAELTARAIDTALDRDRWRRLALELRRCDETGDDPTDGFLWRIHQDAARRANERAELIGQRLALIDRCMRHPKNREFARALRDHVRDCPIELPDPIGTGDTE